MYLKNYLYKLICKLPLSKEDKFNIIAKLKLWGSSSLSGPGSVAEATSSIEAAVKRLVTQLNLKTIANIPCGQIGWFERAVGELNVSCLMGDISNVVIESNIRKNKEERFNYIVFDLCTQKIPEVDLIICRDCLFHLSNASVKSAVHNLEQSNSKYLLLTSHFRSLEDYPVNDDIPDGFFRIFNIFPLISRKYEAVEIFEDFQPNATSKFMVLFKRVNK